MPSVLPLEIAEAIKQPQLIKDPFFSTASLRILPTGRVEMFSGGFSQVFPVVKNGENWAFKVWHTEITNNHIRYQKIKDFIQPLSLPYFIDFDYFQNGIVVNGNFLDTLSMRWIEGMNLTQYISLHLNDREILQKLSEDFAEMVQQLRKHSISHGDLQHENIIINSDGKIFLIDYDSICIPEFEGLPDTCLGRPAFQHPCRTFAGTKASVNVDRFSELVIYLSILAIVENPLLWDKYQVQNADIRLLFKASDFIEWETCDLRKDLLLLSNKIKSLVALFESYLAAHLLLTPF